MNLRQKRKHYKYSERYFVAWFSVLQCKITEYS